MVKEEQRIVSTRLLLPAVFYSRWFQHPTWRLWWLNTKHSVGLWLWPLCLGLAWFAAHNQRPIGAILWLESGDSTGRTAMLIGPLAGGAAAWVAAQDQRRRITPVLEIVPGQARYRHHLVQLASLAPWFWLAYLAFGLYLGVIAWHEATWFRAGLIPIFLAPIWLGFLTILVCLLLGYWAGTVISTTATAPLVALLLFIWLLGLPVFLHASALRYLSPFPFLDFGQGTLVRHWTTIAWPLIGWLGGLSTLLIATLAVRYHRRGATFAVIIAALIVLASVARLALLPDQIRQLPQDWITYEPVCTERSIEVCIHPAFQALLPETARIADTIFAPVVGLPGVPTRIEQYAHWHYPSLPEGTGDLPIYYQSNGPDILASQYALYLVRDPQHDLSPAQCAIGRWLVAQAGLVPEPGWFMPSGRTLPMGDPDAWQRLDNQIEAASKRFAQLPAPEQHTWLAQHWVELRADSLSLEALP